jgi:hypothetical protein
MRLASAKPGQPGSVGAVKIVKAKRRWIATALRFLCELEFLRQDSVPWFANRVHLEK